MDGIFNQEDLLAIANDGGDEPSNSNFSGSEEEEINSSCLPLPIFTPEKREMAVSNDLSPLNEQSKNEFIPEHSGAAKEKGGSNGDSDSSDDDNDGFLAWLDREKSAKKIKTEKDVEENGRGSKQLKIELGASVLQYISSTKSENRGNNEHAQANSLRIGGVVSVEQLEQQEGKDDEIPRNSTLVVTPTESHTKQPHEGMLEEVAPGSSPEKIVRKCCEVFYTSNSDKPSSSGATVDCVARWNSVKECYVLEMVDLVVKPLQDATHSAQIAYEADATATSATGTCAKDPRSSARRAENQLKKLKQGKTEKQGTVREKKNTKK